MTIRKAALPVVLPYSDNGQTEQTFIRSRCNLARDMAAGRAMELWSSSTALAGMPQHENERARAERFFKTREHAFRRAWVETFALRRVLDKAQRRTLPWQRKKPKNSTSCFTTH